MSFILNRTSGTPSGGSVTTLTGNSGGAVGPTAGNIDIVGTGSISVTGNPGTSTLTITNSGIVPADFVTDSGTANPAGGIINIVGDHGINTTGSGDTVTILVDNTLTLGDLGPVTPGFDSLTLTTGDISLAAGNVNLPATSTSNEGVLTIDSTSFVHAYGAGADNVFVGSGAGNFTLTGLHDTALGANSLSSLTDGGSNTAIGHNSCLGLTGGDRNVAVGSASLETITTGTDNIGIGYQAGMLYTTTDSKNIAIGHKGVAAENSTIRIGTNADQTNTYIVGIDGVNVGSVSKVVTMASDHLGTATITAGVGISITPTANTITVTNTGSGGVMAWSVITVDQTAVVNNGYIANKAGTLALLLPATAAIGDTIRVTGINTATGWSITQSANQQIFFGTTQTTLGAGGSLTSFAIRDSIEIVCVVAGASTVWNVISSVGNITVV